MKSILDYGFTNEQLASIYKELSIIKDTNNSLMSSSKIDGIQYFIDRYNNFYIAYCLIDYLSENPAKLVYIKIDGQGTITFLNDLYTNVADIAKRFEAYSEIKL
jgi:hypothetical protein